MVTPLIAGVFALAGVTLGVLLEPVKARVAARQRIRDDRALRCAELVDAASAARAALLRLFRTTRATHFPAPGTSIAEVEEAYWLARTDLKQAALRLRLVAPDSLIARADAVLDSDLALRRLWFDVPHAERGHDREGVSAAFELNAAVTLRFVEAARQA